MHLGNCLIWKKYIIAIFSHLPLLICLVFWSGKNLCTAKPGLFNLWGPGGHTQYGPQTWGLYVMKTTPFLHPGMCSPILPHCVHSPAPCLLCGQLPSPSCQGCMGSLATYTGSRPPLLFPPRPPHTHTLPAAQVTQEVYLQHIAQSAWLLFLLNSQCPQPGSLPNLAHGMTSLALSCWTRSQRREKEPRDPCCHSCKSNE